MHCVSHFLTVSVPVWTWTVFFQLSEQTKLARCCHYFQYFNALPTPTGVIYKAWKKLFGETERLMGEVKVHRMYSRVACNQWFTWLWSSPHFCTRNREGMQKGQRGIRSLAKLERKGRNGHKEKAYRTEKILSKRALFERGWKKIEVHHLPHMTYHMTVCQHHMT